MELFVFWQQWDQCGSTSDMPEDYSSRFYVIDCIRNKQIDQQLKVTIYETSY
jgi:hypothetical protein